MTDLHSRLRAEVERRMEVAKAAAEWAPTPWRYHPVTAKYDGIGGQGHPAMVFAHHLEPTTHVVAFIEQHDPADAIRRYEAALRVLNRHHPYDCDDCGKPVCVECGHDCQDVEDLAASLGVDLDD